MNEKTWIIIALAGLAVWVLLRQRASGPVAAVDTYYAPSAGATLQPGTTPAPSAANGLVQTSTGIPTMYPNLAAPQTTGPAVEARSGRGHF